MTGNRNQERRIQPPGLGDGDLRRFTGDLRPARFPGDRVIPGSLQQLFGGVYFNDPDGNSNEVYFEDIEAFRRRPEEGEYHRQLVGVSS